VGSAPCEDCGGTRLNRHALAVLFGGLSLREVVDSPGAPRLVSCGLDEVATPLADLPPRQRVLLVQTVVRDYLPQPVLERYERAVRTFISTRPALSVLWSQLELCYRDDPLERSMLLSLTMRDVDGALREFALARTHPHPRVLYVDRAELTACRDLIRRANRSVP